MPVLSSWIVAAAPVKNTYNPAYDLFLFAVVLVLGYLFLRTRKTARRRTELLRSTIGVGAQVMTSSGIYATVVGADDDSFELEIAEGVVVRFAKGAVVKVMRTSEDVDPFAELPAQHDETARSSSET